MNKYILVFGLWFSQLQGDNYCIKADYIAHTDPAAVKFYDDRSDHFSKPDNAMYAYARDFAQRHGYKKIIDVGCGTGRHHLAYLETFDTIGYDLPQIVDFACKQRPDRCWRVCDFSKPPAEECDLVVCINVIHHLADPNKLMEFLAQIKCKAVLIATCDREAFERMRMRIDLGPPMSSYNFREWSFSEFRKYVSRWFRVKKHFHSEPRFNQIIVGVPRK